MGIEKQSRTKSEDTARPVPSMLAAAEPDGTIEKKNVALDCGWGRLLFGQTFDNAADLAQCIRAEGPGRRDIAFYISDPHVVLAAAPQALFLDPSHTYRLDLAAYRSAEAQPRGFYIRRLSSVQDAEEVNRIYSARGMVTVAPDFFWSRRDSRAITYFVAEDEATGGIVGTITGVDHRAAYGDHEHGSSLWCLAVDPQATLPGIGVALVRRLAEHFQERGAAYLDLSVIHDNEQAIALYDKLGFVRLPMFTIKRKNVINEALFTEPPFDDAALNPYALIIINEARRRGIGVDIIDAEGGFFRLTYGGRSIVCRESLTALTTAIAMSICDDKRVTTRIVKAANVNVPLQINADDEDRTRQFVDTHAPVVVKPARGEQGKGVAVGLKTWEETAAGHRGGPQALQRGDRRGIRRGHGSAPHRDRLSRRRRRHPQTGSGGRQWPLQRPRLDRAPVPAPRGGHRRRIDHSPRRRDRTVRGRGRLFAG